MLLDAIDCTIDLGLILRQSQQGIAKVQMRHELRSAIAPTYPRSRTIVQPWPASFNCEERHCAVLAGLIGMRDNEIDFKVPILGDMPLVGTLFLISHCTTTVRKPRLLSSWKRSSAVGKPQGAGRNSRDFSLTRPYTNHNVQANPLEAICNASGLAFTCLRAQLG